MKYFIYRVKEAIPRKIAWLLPKKVVMWAYIRVGAYATAGKYGNTVVPEISMMDALDRYSRDNAL